MIVTDFTTFTNTARDFITQALLENAIIPIGDVPDENEIAACLFRFNAMCKSWSARGLSWKQETVEQTGQANTASVLLPIYVREVNGARFVESATNERALSRWERDDYMVLPNKAASGTPTIYYIAKSPGAVNLILWPVPTADFTLKLDIDRTIETITDPAQTVEVPEEWTECVMVNLAMRCCNLFGVEPTAELVSRAQLLEREMMDAWRPASYFMGPA